MSSSAYSREGSDYSAAPRRDVINRAGGECIELRECDERMEEKNKDYYFMDATLLSEYILLALN